MSDSRSCGRCIYFDSLTGECAEELKCMRDVDEAKYTGYIEGKKQGMEKAIEALEKADKYKWHDLRENPEDLPLNFSKVLVCFRLAPKMNIYEVCWYKEGYFCMSFGRRKSENINVLGWREVEPFLFEEDWHDV